MVPATVPTVKVTCSNAGGSASRMDAVTVLTPAFRSVTRKQLAVPPAPVSTRPSFGAPVPSQSAGEPPRALVI
jgi:PKD repeat protein